MGTKIGKYYFPLFAGVAFSDNEFRWSPRIKREDGMVRMVFGLGTRAVDRIGDDYSFLASPGKPGLKVNLDKDDIIKYSQQKVDVLNLESNKFETVSIKDIFSDYADEINGLENIVRGILEENPLSGNLFVFINKKRNKLKVLFWDMDGFCIVYKSLQRGTFLDSMANLTSDTYIEPAVFYMLFNGIDIHHIKRRKRMQNIAA